MGKTCSKISNEGILYGKNQQRTSKGTYIMIQMHFFFLYVLCKSICYWYSFRLYPLVGAIQVSTNTICFHKEMDKI